MWSSKYLNSYLVHSGIKGMHWGIRRFQNPDGSLTPAGRERYGKNGNYQQQRDSKSKVASEGSKVAKSAKQAMNSADRIKKRSEEAKLDKDVKDLSDEELKNEVWRMNMEQQYKDLKTNQTSRGKETVKDILDIAGSTLAATASAFTIAYTIKKLRGG